jgi:hypothetical protein
MCYTRYSKCYHCQVKHGFAVHLCPSGAHGLYCIDPTKVVDGMVTISVKVKFDTHDPDGSPRGCASGMGYSLQDPIAAFMEVHEVGAYCEDCDNEDRALVRNDFVNPRKRAAPRKKMPLKKRKVLGDITSSTN